MEEKICYWCHGNKTVPGGDSEHPTLLRYYDCPVCVLAPKTEKEKREKIESLKCEHCKGSGRLIERPLSLKPKNKKVTKAEQKTAEDIINLIAGDYFGGCPFCNHSGHKLKETLEYLLGKAE